MQSNKQHLTHRSISEQVGELQWPSCNKKSTGSSSSFSNDTSPDSTNKQTNVLLADCFKIDVAILEAIF